MTRNNISKSARIIFASLGAFLSFGASAESDPVTYKYGAKLDIVKVLSITTKDSPVCKPVDYVMKYVDSTGQTHALKYKAHSSACSKRR
ncbi:DUF2790 domain-containing protein [Pseudomonas sp. GD03944]|uniref:DUF2790 domain-containing protein n=1 Tax=Pseudomonas sp. GD03944 TaxID=2975409 RepID=UPI002449D654|nr:DUF2790 domain-containing protein [Pseudomonas sp. GD03944]MDH1265674.1 DUF2790 domain-containing protein [Pseudomonas sp. GD03944]